VQPGFTKDSGMRGGILLGRLFGIDFVADWSLLLIFLLISFSLGAGVFPAWHPDWSPALSWAVALAAATLFFVSLAAHELAHALVGRRVGVEVRRITLFMFGGMAQMEREPPSWSAELVMALAGPLTSLVLGFLFLALSAMVAGPIEIDPERPRDAVAALVPAASLLLWLGPVNIVLAIFNLVPAFPLDGGRVLRAVLWARTGSLVTATRHAATAGQWFAWLLIGTGVAMMLGVRVPWLGTGFMPGTWLAFIGWFLGNAAMTSYRQVLVQAAFVDVPVSRLMQTHVVGVGPGTSVEALIDETMMTSGQRAFPVERDGLLVGMVSLSDLHRVPRGAWPDLVVEEVMRSARDLATVAPGQSVTEAMALLTGRDVNQLPVVDEGRLVGLLRREDLLKWLSLHARDATGGRSGAGA
jgi:Zn-dependent protease/CBS domain-containing protein